MPCRLQNRNNSRCPALRWHDAALLNSSSPCKNVHARLGQFSQPRFIFFFLLPLSSKLFFHGVLQCAKKAVSRGESSGSEFGCNVCARCKRQEEAHYVSFTICIWLQAVHFPITQIVIVIVISFTSAFLLPHYVCVCLCTWITNYIHLMGL